MDETRDCPSIIETKSFIVPDLHTTVLSPLKTEVRHLVARLYPDCEKDTSKVVREISELLLEWDFIYSCFSQLQKVGGILMQINLLYSNNQCVFKHFVMRL